MRAWQEAEALTANFVTCLRCVQAVFSRRIWTKKPCMVTTGLRQRSSHVYPARRQAATMAWGSSCAVPIVRELFDGFCHGEGHLGSPV